MRVMAVKRIKKPLSITLTPELFAELEDFCARQAVEPNKSRVVELALKEFLDRQKADKPR